MNTNQFISKPFSNPIEKVSFTWQTPSNIALVKYWGKSNPQIPKNASISFTLNKCNTITTIHFCRKKHLKNIDFVFFLKEKRKTILN